MFLKARVSLVFRTAQLILAVSESAAANAPLCKKCNLHIVVFHTCMHVSCYDMRRCECILCWLDTAPRSTATRQGQCSQLRSTVFAAEFCQAQLHIRSWLVWHNISFRGDLSAHTRERGKLASDKPVAGLQPNSYWYPRSNMLRGTHCTRFCVRRHAAYGGFNKFRQNFHSFLNEFQSNLRIMRNFLDPKIHLDECVIFHYGLPKVRVRGTASGPRDRKYPKRRHFWYTAAQADPI